MIEEAALDIFLHDLSIFNFDEAYLADEERATLSLAYRDQFGAIILRGALALSPCAIIAFSRS